jgi:hypothetical protein
MPNPSSPLGPFSPLQPFLAPWLFAMPTNPDEAKIAEAGPVWGPALESQARLWSQFIDMQRRLWTFYNPLLQNAPVFMNGEAKTVAEDEAGLEPAETVDGIPDAFELQARTWNHFLDANKNFWSAFSWPGAALPNGTVTVADAAAQEAGSEEAEEEEAEEAPARARRAPPARKQAHARARR